MAVENERWISTLNYVLRFINNSLVSREKKQYIKPYEYLNKYMYAVENLENNIKNEHIRSDIIWQCWLQGEENMPNLVKVCTDSIKEFNKNRKVILITEQKIKEYVSVPDYVLEKYKKGIIPYAQFSDIIRLMLLEKYGGVWIDSTMLLTGNLPEDAFTLEFFTYKNTLGLCFDRIKNLKDLEIMCNHLNCCLMLPSTWFLSSTSNNIIVSGWLKLLLEYWKNEDILVDYFIMDYFFVLLMLNNEKCREEFLKIPAYLTTPINILQSVMPEDFDADLFEEIKSMSPLHKLTLNYTPDKSNNNRFYNKILNA